jgi:hypothetical protein
VESFGIVRHRIIVGGHINSQADVSWVTATFDSRSDLCAADLPFLCGGFQCFKTSEWPEMNEWVKAKPHRSWE